MLRISDFNKLDYVIYSLTVVLVFVNIWDGVSTDIFYISILLGFKEGNT